MLPLALAIIARRHLHPAVPVLRERAGAGQGHRAEPAEPDGDLRGHVSGSSRTATSPARSGLHPDGTLDPHDARPDVLHRLRPVDGLRGVPPLPHQGGARPDRRQHRAVAVGLQRSDGIITAAALLIAVVFTAFLPSTLTNIKIMGLGVTVAILIDATIVRVLLVPAFMRIAGRANWWAPPALRRLHARFGITEG